MHDAIQIWPNILKRQCPRIFTMESRYIDDFSEVLFRNTYDAIPVGSVTQRVCVRESERERERKRLSARAREREREKELWHF
jgi:hypothetical protein